MKLPELTYAQEQTLKEKFREHKKLTSEERELVRCYGEYRFQTTEAQKAIKRELARETIKFFLLIPDTMSLGAGLLMWGCLLIGGIALLMGA